MYKKNGQQKKVILENCRFSLILILVSKKKKEKRNFVHFEPLQIKLSNSLSNLSMSENDNCSNVYQNNQSVESDELFVYPSFDFLIAFFLSQIIPLSGFVD